MEIGLPQGDEGDLLHDVVKQHVLDDKGRSIGTESLNPIVNTCLYKVEFLDCSKELLTVNEIAENLLSQVDQKGHQHLLLQEILDHRASDNTINKER